jgi:hypothetical protein
MRVYFHSLQNLTQARYAASVMPDYLGFCFSKQSDTYLPPLSAADIIPWLSGNTLVAQFQYETADEIRSIALSLQINTIEIPVDHPDMLALTGEFQVISLDGVSPNVVACRYTVLNPLSAASDVMHSDAVYGYQPLEGNVQQMWSDIQRWGLTAIALCGSHEEEVGLSDVSAWVELMDTLE